MGWRDDPVAETIPWEQDPVAPPSVAEDVGYSIPGALGRIPFAIAGAPAAFTGLGMEAGRGLDYAWQKYIQGRENPDVETAEQVQARNPLAHLTPQALEETFWEKPTGTQFYDPQTDIGKITAATITGAGAGALTGGGVGGGPGTLVSGAATGAGGGAGAEYARQLTEGTPWEIPATLAGGIAGGFGGQGAATGVRKVVSPRTITPQQARFAGILKQGGVKNLTEGQISWDDQLRAAELKRIPATHQARQYGDVTEFALGKIGEKGRVADDIKMNQVFEDVSNEYTKLAGRNTMQFDPQLGAELKANWDEFTGLVAQPSQAPAVGRYLTEIRNHLLKGPTVSGDVYQSLRSRMQDTARKLGKSTENQQASETLFHMVNSLDDAMERSIVATNPRDAGAFRSLRTKYRNVLVVEDAVSRSGEWAARGLVTPDALASATKRWHGERNWVRGKGPFAEFSRAAAATLRPLPPTGRNPIGKVPLSTMNAVAMVPALIGRGIDKLRMSDIGQKYMTNRMMPKPPGTVSQRTMTGAIPPLAAALQPDYSAVTDALSRGEGTSEIRPEILADPRIQSIIDALQ